MMIYIDGSSKNLVEDAIAAIIEQNGNADLTFVIDLDS